MIQNSPAGFVIEAQAADSFMYLFNHRWPMWIYVTFRGQDFFSPQ